MCILTACGLHICNYYQVAITCTYNFEAYLQARLGPPLNRRDTKVVITVQGVRRPKHGCSGGLPVALSIIAARHGAVIRQDVLAAGEITLSGGILPVSDVSEKIQAVAKKGTKYLTVPAENMTRYWVNGKEGEQGGVVKTETLDTGVTLIPVVDILQAVDIALVPREGTLLPSSWWCWLLYIILLAPLIHLDMYVAVRSIRH